MREELAVRTLTPLVPPGPVAHIADQLDALLPTLDLAGRPLAAAHLTVTGAPTPVARLWRAVTVLREYRGDGHVATLVAAGLDGAEANLTHAATGALPSEQRTNRGWTEADWANAYRRLRRRGWLNQSGALTPAGRAGRESIEAATDASVARVGDGWPNASVRALTLDLVRISAGPVKVGIPYPNAMGVLRP